MTDQEWMNTVCEECGTTVLVRPKTTCTQRSHFDLFCDSLQFELKKAHQALEMHDDDRDKLDVANILRHMPRVRSYGCGGCGRQFELPIHLVHVTCACGRRCRLRHLGGTDPIGDVIDAAMALIGAERNAQLAYLAEIHANGHSSKENFMKWYKQETDRWYLDADGWRKK